MIYHLLHVLIQINHNQQNNYLSWNQIIDQNTYKNIHYTQDHYSIVLESKNIQVNKL